VNTLKVVFTSAVLCLNGNVNLLTFLWFVNLDNFWIVYFLDAGNVWTDVVTFKPRDISLAVGFGIRYETLFGPFRVDFGFRVYDPKEGAGKQWIFQKRLFGDVLSNGVLHFGLGHAF